MSSLPPLTSPYLVELNQDGAVVDIKMAADDHNVALGNTYITPNDIMVTWVRAPNDIIAVILAKKKLQYIKGQEWKYGEVRHLYKSVY